MECWDGKLFHDLFYNAVYSLSLSPSLTPATSPGLMWKGKGSYEWRDRVVCLPRVVLSIQSSQNLLLVISKTAVISCQLSLGEDPELTINRISCSEISWDSIGRSSQQTIHKRFVV